MSNILAVINSSAELIPYYCGESEQSKYIKSITDIVRNQVDRGAKLVSNVNMIFKRGNRELIGSKGMGIGLSLVKKIIKGYDGKIWIEDKVKNDYTKGSNFIFMIPEANQKFKDK